MNALSLLLRRTAVVAARRAPVLQHVVYRAMVTKPSSFAVEAPDGTSDALMDAELHQVEDIIEHAAQYEDPAFVAELHHQQEDAAKIFAVDGPDGESEDIHQEDLHAVEEVIEYAAKHEDKEQVVRGHQLEAEIRKAMSKRAGFPDY